MRRRKRSRRRRRRRIRRIRRKRRRGRRRRRRKRRRRRWHYNPIKEISHVADCCQHSGGTTNYMIQPPDIIHVLYSQCKYKNKNKYKAHANCK